jgi:hypothetical protein
MLTGVGDCIQNCRELYRITYRNRQMGGRLRLKPLVLATRYIQNIDIERGLSMMSRSDTWVGIVHIEWYEWCTFM